MSILRAAILFAALAAPAAASATSFDDIAAKTNSAVVAQTFADAVISRRPLLLEDAAPSTQRYFDYDALLTLGALALSVAAFTAFARRPREEPAQRPEIDGVVRWMQHDLSRPFAHPRDAA